MMHPAPHHAAPPRPAPRPATGAPALPAAAFFTALYGLVAGYIEVRAGVNCAADPNQLDLVPLNEAGEWFAYHPGELPRLCALVDTLAARYGNVYVSEHVYTRPRRDAPVKPGRAIVIEDAPLGTPCSLFVQTSPKSGHAHILLDRDAPAHVLLDLARRGAATLGGDPSGADLQQLVRVPGTVNTKAKHGGGYLVITNGDTGRRYSVAALEAAWPAGVPAARASLDRADVEAWQGNRADLFTAAGVPRRWKNPTIPGWRVLRGDLVPPSTSEARYIIISSLVKHYYPDSEILVIARQIADFDASTKKGSAWLDADILRCAAKYRARCGISNADAQPTRLRGTQPTQPLPTVTRAKKGRKVALTPAELLMFYEDARAVSDVVLLTVNDVAVRLGVSRATIERCERVLRTENAIERRCIAGRQSSVVAILRPVTIDSAPVASAEEPPRYVPSDDTQIPHHKAENGEQHVHEGTHPLAGAGAVPSAALPALPVVAGAACAAGAVPPRAPGLPAGGRVPSLPATPAPAAAAPACPPTLTQLACDCYDAYPGTRITAKRFAAYVAANAAGRTFAPSALDRARKAEQLRRQQDAGRGFWETLNAEIAGLGTRSQQRLEALDASTGRTVWEGQRVAAARVAGDRRAKMPRGLMRAKLLRSHIVDELHRRDRVEDARQAQGIYTETEQAAFLALVEAARSGPRPAARVAVAAKLTPPASVPEVRERYNVPDMIARLKARLTVTA